MAGIDALQNLAPSLRVTQESKVDMQRIVSTGEQKVTRVAGQSQDNFVNLSTSQTGSAEANEQYSHQRYIAYNAYINLGRDENAPTAAERFEQIQNAGKAPEGETTGTTTGSTEEGKNVEGTEEASESKKTVDPDAPRGSNGEELSEEEQAEVQDMKARDEEVRIHEQAHQSAGGQYASAPKYEYANGPDGKRYITDGSVSIDVSEEGDPQATINKMQVVKRAALAPAEPSAQDRKVYSEAAQKEAEARRELSEQKQEEAQEQTESASNASGSAASGASSSGAASAAPAAGTASQGSQAQGSTSTQGATPAAQSVGNSMAPRTIQNPSAGEGSNGANSNTTGSESSEKPSLVPEDTSIPEGITEGTSRLSQGTLDSNRKDDDVPQLV